MLLNSVWQCLDKKEQMKFTSIQEKGTKVTVKK